MSNLLNLSLPNWLKNYLLKWEGKIFSTPEEKMELAIKLAKENIKQNTGGPFGAAIFEINSGKLLSIGVNLVTYSKFSSLHAEIVAFFLAQKKVNHYRINEIIPVELYSSSEPCAMCLGACLWAGIDKVVFGAPAKAARDIGFDEGPIFKESWEYLEQKGIKIKGPFLEKEAKKVLQEYQQANKIIY